MSTPSITPSTLNLVNVELVSTIHTAPANGAPSSENYYDGEVEKVTDLTTIVTFINNTLLPMLNALAASAASGILGTGVYSDTSSQDELVYDSLTENWLTITESMRILYGQIQTSQTALINISQQVGSLQARLSASNQNDVSLALQNITSSVAQNAAQVTALANSISSMQFLLGTTMDARVETPNISPEGTESVPVEWTEPFSDNTYVVTYGLEDDSGFLQITGFSYMPNGTGVLIYVKNNDPANDHQGYVHAEGRISQLTA